MMSSLCLCRKDSSNNAHHQCGSTRSACFVAHSPPPFSRLLFSPLNAPFMPWVHCFTHARGSQSVCGD